MPAHASYQTQHTSAQIDAYYNLTAEAFVGISDSQRRWVDILGHDQVRALVVGEEVIGGLMLVPFAHYFGGRRVSAVGISGVAVAAQHRAGGTATTLMMEMLKEQYAAGVAISTLYPATVKLYRRTGYEQAGHSTIISVPLHSVDTRDRSLELEPLTTDHHAAITELYQAAAIGRQGHLERGKFQWEDIFIARDDQRRLGYVVLDNGSPAGYVIYNHTRPTDSSPSHIQVRDWVATTPEVGRRILTFLADHRTVRGDAQFYGPPHDPMFALLGEFPWSFKLNEIWMLRIVNIAHALEQRGYPTGVTAEVHLRVADDGLSENAGDWVLNVSEGVGRVSPGGRGEIAIDIRHLASLYSGYRTPADLKQIHAVQGPDASLAALGSVFAGPVAWMRDWF